MFANNNRVGPTNTKMTRLSPVTVPSPFTTVALFRKEHEEKKEERRE